MSFMALPLSVPIILDGATGSQLQMRGMPVGTCPEQWILEHGDVLIQLQQEYIEAGSNIIYAPTFGANSAALERNGICGKTREMNIELVSLSKRAAAGRALVAGDISPTGLQPAPFGSSTFDDIYETYLEQVSALAEAGVDLFVIETSMSLAEARAALLAVKSISDKPAIVSFTVGESGKTLYGDSLTSALAVSQALGAAAFGINCCGDLGLMCKLFAELSPFAQIPLLAKPNAGLPEMIDGKAIYNLSARDFANFSLTLGKLGVGLIGGCCGTSPEHIKALSAAVAKMEVATFVCTKTLCASKREILEFSSDTRAAEIACSEDLLEDIEDAISQGAELIKLNIADMQALAAFLEYVPLVEHPICISAGDLKLLETAARNYCGVALCDMPRSEQVKDICKRYGMTII